MGSVLNEKTVLPTDELLSAVLKESKPLWDEFINHIATAYKKPSEEWKFYGKASGWTLAVISDKRRLINMVPKSGYFQAVFTLSEKAAAIGRDLGLPIPADTKCVCGYGFDIDVRTAADVDIIKKMLEIKDKN